MHIKGKLAESRVKMLPSYTNDNVKLGDEEIPTT